MNEEDEAFTEIERRAKQRMESVKVAVHTLTEYQRGYENGFIDGMQKQAQSSVDKAVNAISQRTWAGLTPEEILDMFDDQQVYGSKWLEFAREIENRLKEKNS